METDQGDVRGEESFTEEFSFMQWLSRNKIITSIIILVVISFIFRCIDLRRRFFAAFENKFQKDNEGKSNELKKDVFETLGSVVSQDPVLRKIGALRILEIGVGSGTNFAFYPDGTHLVVVDPNPHFQQYFDDNKKKFPNIQSEEIIVSTGEEMDMVPDNSVDVVVVTLVFCSVTDTQKVLKQILRVLVPGGKFYFYEHIAEFDTTKHNLRKHVQSFLTVTGIWQFLFNNCHLNRDMLKDVEEAGFAKVEAKRFHAQMYDHPVFQVAMPSLRGVAQK